MLGWKAKTPSLQPWLPLFWKHPHIWSDSRRETDVTSFTLLPPSNPQKNNSNLCIFNYPEQEADTYFSIFERDATSLVCGDNFSGFINGIKHWVFFQCFSPRVMACDLDRVIFMLSFGIFIHSRYPLLLPAGAQVGSPSSQLLVVWPGWVRSSEKSQAAFLRMVQTSRLCTRPVSAGRDPQCAKLIKLWPN